jgi:hypothetical protein
MSKKKSKKKSNKKAFSKINILFLILTFVLAGLFYYAFTPAINFQSRGFCICLLIICLLLGLGTLNFDTDKANEIYERKSSKVLFIISAFLLLFIVVMGIGSSKLLQAKKYASLIQVETGDFATDIVETENINDIAIMDTETARIIGDRAIGSLSDVVSQYEVNRDYSTIDYNGKPVKVSSLEYVGFFKWLNNREEGIPGYVMVDPITNEAQYIKLNQPIKYTTSGWFNDNLQRHVQLQYPTAIFEDYYFELDNEGNPYYICPVLQSNAGLYGAKDVKGVVICNPCTGDSQYYDVADVPNWVDRVYDGDLAEQKYDWYGTLSGGFWNSVIGNKGCKETTDDYGYKVIDGDVWAYTGVTSVNSDESNIGFVLINLRTCESKYYEISGAEEYSAMASAEGQVQNLGYDASFPSLINISNTPTYIMALKDSSGLVKMYALVNVEKYNIVATGKTQNEALSEYRKLLTEYNITSSEVSQDDYQSKKITVQDIKFLTVDGDTVVYITDQAGQVYKEKFSEDETLILIQPEDKITVYYQEGENGIHTMYGYES